MPQSVTFREAFTSQATYTAASPGNLGTISGAAATPTFFGQIAVGPKLTGGTEANGAGVSADCRICTRSATNTISYIQHKWLIDNTNGRLDGWCKAFYYVTKIIPNASNAADFLFTRQTNTNQVCFVRAKPASNGHFWVNVAGIWTDTDTGVTIPLKQWFELRHSWHWTGTGTTIDYKVAYRLAGGSSWVTIFAGTLPNFVDEVWGGLPNQGSPAYVLGRYGMPSVVKTGGISERDDLESGIVDPPTATNTWYIRNAAGATQYGNSSGDAMSFTNYQTRAQYSTFLPGDTVDFEAGLDVGNGTVEITHDDHIANFNSGCPKAYSTIAAGSWSLSTGTTRTYETTDGSATDLTGAVLWEDAVWLNKLKLNDYANEAALLTDLDTAGKSGYFYCNDTKMYFNSPSSPASNGKTYVRSRNHVGALGSLHASGNGASLICPCWCTNGTINGLYAPDAYMTLAAKADNDPFNAYVVQWDDGCAGAHTINSPTVGRWSKHGLGRTTSASNLTVTRNSPTYGPGSPYVGFGGQSADVDFCASGTGNQGIYVRPLCAANIGGIGTTGGVANTGQPFWLDHGGASNNFSLIKMSNGRVCSGLLEQGTMSGGTIRLVNMSYASLSPGNATVQIVKFATQAVPAAAFRGVSRRRR